MKPTRIGLFGGTFDPIHLGHMIMAQSALEQANLDEIRFIPSARPPHKGANAVSNVEHRLEMIRLATAEEILFTVDDCETRRSGPSYSLDTVQCLSQTLGENSTLVWIIGADSLAELHTWYRVPELVKACEIVTVARPGWDAPDLESLRTVLDVDAIEQLRRRILTTPRIDISATEIRNRVRQGKSIRFLVPEPVRRYIADHQLYSRPA